MNPRCPYCGRESLFKNAGEVYGAKWSHVGNLYVCAGYPKCDSYVGCHKGTDKPLGRMANKELRQSKSKAHQMFDALWRKKMATTGLSKKVCRGLAYAWLSKQTGIDPDRCHIGMMDVDQCRKVAAACSPYHKKSQRRMDGKKDSRDD